MGISIGSDSIYKPNAIMNNTSADKMEEKLKNNNATDKELMDACKQFESYLLEQVFKGMEKTVEKNEEKGAYLEQFGDTLYEEYAKSATENQGLGIAQMLYDSMKRK